MLSLDGTLSIDGVFVGRLVDGGSVIGVVHPARTAPGMRSPALSG